MNKERKMVKIWMKNKNDNMEAIDKADKPLLCCGLLMFVKTQLIQIKLQTVKNTFKENGLSFKLPIHITF